MAIVGACKILSFAADNGSSPVLTVERSTNGPAQILLTTAPNQTNILETSISMRAWFPVLVYPATNRVVTFQCRGKNKI